MGKKKRNKIRGIKIAATEKPDELKPPDYIIADSGGLAAIFDKANGVCCETFSQNIVPTFIGDRHMELWRIALGQPAIAEGVPA